MDQRCYSSVPGSFLTPHPSGAQDLTSPGSFNVYAYTGGDPINYEGEPRPEKAAQRLFFAVAHAYCKANNLDVTREADTGNGPVNFKVSQGFQGRVLVEIKLSRNGKLLAGYTRQLETYKSAEETSRGYYVVIDVGQMGRKAQELLTAKNAADARGEKTSPIIFIDGVLKASASEL